MPLPHTADIRKVFELLILTKAELGAIETDPTPLYVPSLADVGRKSSQHNATCLGSFENDNKDLKRWKKDSPVGDRGLVWRARWVAFTDEKGCNTGRLLGEAIVKIESSEGCDA